MPGVAPVNGWLKVSKTDKTEDAIADLKLYGQVLGAEIEGWATERVRDVLRTRHYFHAMHFPRAFHMHPLNYALGLAAAAEQAGARIFEGTPALSIDPDGVRKRIATPHGRIRASHIVLACNVHLGALMPRAAGTLLPIWTYMFVTAPLGPRLLDAIRYRGAVSDTDLADNHYRIVDGDRLLFSGRSTTWEADPAPLRRQAQGGPGRALSADRRRRGGARLVRRARQRAAPDAAARRTDARLLDGVGLRRTRPQHHGDGRQHPGARDRRRRRQLAAVLALRIRLGRRQARPRRQAGLLLGGSAPASATRRARLASARRKSNGPTAANRNLPIDRRRGSSPTWWRPPICRRSRCRLRCPPTPPWRSCRRWRGLPATSRGGANP